MSEPQGRTWVKVPAVYAATPRVLITGWLDGVSLSALLDGRMDLLPEGWRELSPGDAANLAARLLGHAIYASAACTGWMHADLHPGNFLLLPGGRAVHPIVATAAADTFTYSRPWLRGLMAHFTEPRFVPALRNLTPPRDYALFWRATLSAAGLYAQLGATVPTRGFHLAYSPGFRDSVRGGQSRPRLALGPAGLP